MKNLKQEIIGQFESRCNSGIGHGGFLANPGGRLDEDKVKMFLTLALDRLEAGVKQEKDNEFHAAVVKNSLQVEEMKNEGDVLWIALPKAAENFKELSVINLEALLQGTKAIED